MFERPKDISPEVYEVMKKTISKDVVKRVPAYSVDRYLKYAEKEIRDLAKWLSETQDRYNSPYSNIGYMDKVQERVDKIANIIVKRVRAQYWITIKIDTKEILKSIKLIIEQNKR